MICDTNHSLRHLSEQSTESIYHSAKKWLSFGFGLFLLSTAAVADDTFGTAIEIQPGEISAALSPVGDVDHFKFTVTSAQVVTIATKASAVGVPPTNLGIQLFDSNNSLIGSAASGQEPSDPNISKLLQPGTYYVKSQSLFKRTGAYRLVYKNQSSALPFTETIQGNLDVINDWKTYKFTVATPGFFQLWDRKPSISTPAINIRRILRDEAGNQLNEETNTGKVFSRILNPGNYFITVSSSPFLPNVGDYDLKFISSDNAVPIKEGTSSGTIDVPLDQDYYRFVVTGNSPRTIRLVTSGTVFLAPFIYNELGQTLLRGRGTQKYDEELTLDPGIYYLLLSGTSASGVGSFGKYFFTLSGTMPAAHEIDVQQPAGKQLKDGTPLRNFGTAKVGAKRGITKTFVINNVGNETLKGINVSITGKNRKDFKIVTRPVQSLTKGKSTTFKVTFMPKAAGNKSARLKIASNDADENPFDIPLSGKSVK